MQIPPRTFTIVLCLLGALLASSAQAQIQPRIRPLPSNEWSPKVEKMLGGTRNRVAELEGHAPIKDKTAEPKTLNILRTLAHHPDLMGPFLGFASALAQEGALTRRDSEILALRASWNCQSEFEWGHHVEYGQTAGLTMAEIARIPLGPNAPGWTQEDRMLLEAADQLHAGQQISDALWSRLSVRFTEKQLVEIPFVVGQYTMLSMFANAARVELEAGYDGLPQLK